MLPESGADSSEAVQDQTSRVIGLVVGAFDLIGEAWLPPVPETQTIPQRC
jgi:hypothetical protein